MARRIEHRSREQLAKDSSTLLALEQRRAKAPPAVLSVKEVEQLKSLLADGRATKSQKNSDGNINTKVDDKVNGVAHEDEVEEKGGEDANFGGKRKRDAEELPQGWPEGGVYVCEEDDRCIDIARRFDVDLERVSDFEACSSVDPVQSIHMFNRMVYTCMQSQAQMHVFGTCWCH